MVLSDLVVVDHAEDLPALVPGRLLVQGAPDGLRVAGHHVGGEGEDVVPVRRHRGVPSSLYLTILIENEKL